MMIGWFDVAVNIGSTIGRAMYGSPIEQH